MGGAVVGSALTTVGCAVFLLLCQLVIFTKIGAVVAGVTCFAIVYALLPLPALLMIIGPCGHDFTSCLNAAGGKSQKPVTPQKQEESKKPVSEREKLPVVLVRPTPKQEDSMVRRYVLSMPSKSMSQKAADANALRTRVTAAG